jgi:hypothetical protein
MADKPAAKVGTAETYPRLPDGLFLFAALMRIGDDEIVLTKIARLRILPYIKSISYR